MKLFISKIWYWHDIGLLKWSALMFGMIAGAYLSDIVKNNVVWFGLAAVLLAIRPAFAYWKK